MVSHWLIKKIQLSLSISNSAKQSLICHFTTYLHSRFQVYGFCVRYVAKPFFSAFFLCHLLFLLLTARNTVINLDKLTTRFHTILEAFFYENLSSMVKKWEDIANDLWVSQFWLFDHSGEKQPKDGLLPTLDRAALLKHYPVSNLEGMVKTVKNELIPNWNLLQR